MKVCTILGTRPEIIRLSRIMPKLDERGDHHILFTGQNYDARLNDIFWTELGIRLPDTSLTCGSSSFGEQAGKILVGVEDTLRQVNPDRVLILGDTNSGLSAIIAARLGITVFHMEAGNRCFDNRVPEEINRRIIDHTSTFNLPYTERSRDHLLKEGFPLNRILVSGNPIGEVLVAYDEMISQRTPWTAVHGDEPFMLATFHRSENVDCATTLGNIVQALQLLAQEAQCLVRCSIHPRTRDKIQKFGIQHNPDELIFSEPFGFFDFVALEKNAQLVLTDSGTVQEECAILGTPCVVMRRSTERIECVECGASIVAGTRPESILNAARTLLQSKRDWQIPAGYVEPDVSNRVVNYLQGILYVG